MTSSWIQPSDSNQYIVIWGRLMYFIMNKKSFRTFIDHDSPATIDRVSRNSQPVYKIFIGFIKIVSSVRIRPRVKPILSGPLTRYANLRIVHAPGMPGTFPRHRLQRKRYLAIPACITAGASRHVPWCISGSLTHGGGENVTSIPGACATRSFTYRARGSWVIFDCI